MTKKAKKPVLKALRAAEKPKEAKCMLALEAAPTFIEGAAGADGKPGLPRFTMVANAGSPMRLWGWDAPVVVDMAGVDIPAQALPIRRGHDPMLLVGHTDSVTVEGGKILAAGVFSFDTAAAKEIVTSAKNGFPWQASIGAQVLSAEFVDEGEEALVNGQQQPGPVYIARKSLLGEISVVDLGADRNTSTSVAAQANHQEEKTMTKEQKAALAAARAHLAAGRLEEAVTAFQILASITGNADVDTLKADIEAAQEAPAPEADPVKDIRASTAGEMKRIASVQAAAGKHFDVAAEAVEKGWDVERTKAAVELKVLRATRPAAPTSHSHSAGPVTGELIECAVLLAAKVSGNDLITKHGYKADVVEAADKRFKGRIGLQQMLLMAARENGYSGDSVRGDLRSVLRAAFPQDVQAEGFSTMSLPGTFANLLNKRLEQGFRAVESTWRDIASIRPVNDFKAVTSYKLSSDMKYEKVAGDGELKHGQLSESTYSNKADTYGKLFSITRQDIINDDLGALTEVPMHVGRGAALKFNEVFWALLMGGQNAGFFDNSAYGNLDASTSSLLSVDGLTLAETKFRNLTDPKGFPLGVAPAGILVPNALKTLGGLLYKSLEVRDNTANTKTPTMNPHAGAFPVTVSSYLSNAAISSYYSAKHWYMFANPAELSAIEACFLNGQEMPTVETAQAEFDTLGIQIRGYHDFGVALHEPRAMIKLRGEA